MSKPREEIRERVVRELWVEEACFYCNGTGIASVRLEGAVERSQSSMTTLTRTITYQQVGGVCAACHGSGKTMDYVEDLP